MAGTPSTRAQGQGAAQVFDTSGLANQYGQQVEAERQKKADEKKELEKKIAELAGDDDVFNEKYFATRDDKMIRGDWEDIKKEFKGKWNKAVQTGTPEYYKYKEMVQNLKFKTKLSEETKHLITPYLDDLETFNPESQVYFKEVISTPGMVFDPSKMKKINNFDVIKDFELNKENFKQDVKNNPTNTGLVPLKDGGYTYGKNITATEQQRKGFMDSMITKYSSDEKALDKINQMYGEEAEKLGMKPLELFAEKMYPTTAIDIKDRSYTGLGGAGKKEPFNPNNIVDTATIKTQEEGVNPAFEPWMRSFGVKGKGVIENSTSMYQIAEPIRSTMPVSKKWLDMETNKPVQDIGTYQVEMGSPILVDGEVMVPALMKGVKGDKGEVHVSVLIPANEAQAQFQGEGYDMQQIVPALKSKASEMTPEQWNAKWKNLPKGETMTGLDGIKYTKK